MSFARYPTCKDSGVEWLGEVPGHWGVAPVKNLATIVNGYPFGSAQFDPAEGAPLIPFVDGVRTICFRPSAKTRLQMQVLERGV